MDDELRLSVHIAEQRTDDHDQQLFYGLDKVRTALNGDTSGFREFEKLDFRHEEREIRRLFLAWVNEDGTYKYPPHLWAMFLSNHVLSLEKWSNHFSIFITVMGTATAVFALRLKEQPELFATTVLFTFVAAVMKWHIDRQIVSKKKTINRLNSFSPNNALQPTSGRDAAFLD